MMFFTRAFASNTSKKVASGAAWAAAFTGMAYSGVKFQMAEEERLRKENPGATVTFEYKPMGGMGYFQPKVVQPEKPVEEPPSNRGVFSAP